MLIWLVSPTDSILDSPMSRNGRRGKLPRMEYLRGSVHCFLSYLYYPYYFYHVAIPSIHPLLTTEW
jgi:hypothetical protein